MTYAIGLSAAGHNAIITDLRVTFHDGKKVAGKNTSLKSGILFPTCIFARVGNVEHSRIFIRQARNALSYPTDSNAIWKEFEDFATAYSYPIDPRLQFKLLLSTQRQRQKQAEFFVLDSSTRSIQPTKSIITLGSGKSILDQLVLKNYRAVIDALMEKSKDRPFHNEMYPYLFCMWLTQLTKSFERVKLEEAGVGGVFHFIFHGPQGEYTQKPAFYVLFDLDKQNNQVFWWQYRVCYVEDMLVVDEMIPPRQDNKWLRGAQNRTVIVDRDSVQNETTGLHIAGQDDWEETVNSAIEDQPLYYFCGLAFTNPAHRDKGFVFHMTNTDKYIISDEGIEHDGFNKKIAEILSDT
ncbi:MAG TPA: hypothetical protein ENF20_04635 [Candidatus Marinimicrobia bacterium]|nr:hypothetical protein [Candidatus Neomarinimicrobiota bacterium]